MRRGGGLFCGTAAGAALVLALLLPADAAGGAEALDGGTLDPRWFGGSREFRRVPAVDYLWVSESFDIEGRTLHFEPWAAPVFLGEDAGKRDGEDLVLARQISSEMPALLELQFGADLAGKAAVSLEEGDILVSGRIVDCSRGNQMVKFLAPTVAGKGLARLEMKFVDTESGELLAGLHTRVTSGTALTNTWNKMVKWVRKFSREVAENGLQEMYRGGKPVRD
jgi:hypothetical protein